MFGIYFSGEFILALVVLTVCVVGALIIGIWHWLRHLWTRKIRPAKGQEWVGQLWGRRVRVEGYNAITGMVDVYFYRGGGSQRIPLANWDTLVSNNTMFLKTTH